MSIFTILMTTSKSGLVIFMALIGALFLMRSVRWKNLIMVMIFSTLFGVTIPIGTVVFGNWDALMDGLDKDPTMSGRTDIWSYAYEMIQREERTALGYGRAIFWNQQLNYAKEAGDRVMGATTLYSSSTYKPPNAHNGWVDMMLEVGFVGVFSMACSVLLIFTRTIRRVYITETPEDFWPMLFMVFFLFYNMTESLMLRGESLFWVMYITNAFSVRLGGQLSEIEHPSMRSFQALKFQGLLPPAVPHRSRR